MTAEPGVERPPLYYKPLQKIRKKEFNKRSDNFASFMNVPLGSHKILNWWITELPKCSKAVSWTPK